MFNIIVDTFQDATRYKISFFHAGSYQLISLGDHGLIFSILIQFNLV